MILSTTNSVDGGTIAEYMRIVGGEAIVGMNVFKDFAAGIRNIVGGARPRGGPERAVASRRGDGG